MSGCNKQICVWLLVSGPQLNGNDEVIKIRTCKSQKEGASIYKPAPGKPVVFRRQRVSLALRVQILLRATSASKKKKKVGEKRGNRKEKNRTYRRVGLLHRHAQGEDEQRQGELVQALQVFIHLWDNK